MLNLIRIRLFILVLFFVSVFGLLPDRLNQIDLSLINDDNGDNRNFNSDEISAYMKRTDKSKVQHGSHDSDYETDDPIFDTRENFMPKKGLVPPGSPVRARSPGAAPDSPPPRPYLPLPPLPAPRSPLGRSRESVARAFDSSDSDEDEEVFPIEEVQQHIDNLKRGRVVSPDEEKKIRRRSMKFSKRKSEREQSRAIINRPPAVPQRPRPKLPKRGLFYKVPTVAKIRRTRREGKMIIVKADPHTEGKPLEINVYLGAKFDEKTFDKFAKSVKSNKMQSITAYVGKDERFTFTLKAKESSDSSNIASFGNPESLDLFLQFKANRQSLSTLPLNRPYQLVLLRSVDNELNIDLLEDLLTQYEFNLRVQNHYYANMQPEEFVEDLVNNDIRVFVFDFDKTTVPLHSKGWVLPVLSIAKDKYRQQYEGIVHGVTPDTIAVKKAADKHKARFAIATMSDAASCENIRPADVILRHVYDNSRLGEFNFEKDIKSKCLSGYNLVHAAFAYKHVEIQPDEVVGKLTEPLLTGIHELDRHLKDVDGDKSFHLAEFMDRFGFLPHQYLLVDDKVDPNDTNAAAHGHLSVGVAPGGFSMGNMIPVFEKKNTRLINKFFKLKDLEDA